MKVDIIEFEGKLDPNEFLEELRNIERVFNCQQILEDKKVKVVALKLLKYVSTWWFNKCTKHEKQCREKVRSWEKMRKPLKEKFLMQENFNKLHHLQQG